MLSREKNIGYLNCNQRDMKNLIVTALLVCLGTGFGFSQEKETIDLTIDVTVSKYNKGSIFLALYNSEETYMKKGYKSAKVAVANNKATISIKNIEKGSYAFSMFHDVNSNGKMDKNFMGIPKEPYGFSNDKKGRFGPPDYEKVTFELKKDATIQVTIK